MADSPPNRNVVSRRVAEKPRADALTTEIDCSAFAKLVEEEASSDPVDLDAEIEVVTALSDQPTRSAARFAHTLPREAPEAGTPKPTLEMPTLTLEQLTSEPEPER